jgi:hypothetical protein
MYFIQEIEITPKRHAQLLMKVVLKLNFTLISSMRNGSCYLKK